MTSMPSLVVVEVSARPRPSPLPARVMWGLVVAGFSADTLIRCRCCFLITAGTSPSERVWLREVSTTPLTTFVRPPPPPPALASSKFTLRDRLSTSPGDL